MNKKLFKPNNFIILISGIAACLLLLFVVKRLAVPPEYDILAVFLNKPVSGAYGSQYTKELNLKLERYGKIYQEKTESAVIGEISTQSNNLISAFSYSSINGNGQFLTGIYNGQSQWLFFRINMNNVMESIKKPDVRKIPDSDSYNRIFDCNSTGNMFIDRCLVVNSEGKEQFNFFSAFEKQGCNNYGDGISCGLFIDDQHVVVQTTEQDVGKIMQTSVHENRWLRNNLIAYFPLSKDKMPVILRAGYQSLDCETNATYSALGLSSDGSRVYFLAVYPEFSPKEITSIKSDIGDLVSNISEHSSPGCNRIWKLLDNETQDEIKKYDSWHPVSKSLKVKLFDNLNSILHRRDYYTTGILNNKLADEDEKALAVKADTDINSLNEAELYRLNRILMENEIGYLIKSDFTAVLWLCEWNLSTYMTRKIISFPYGETPSGCSDKFILPNPDMKKRDVAITPGKSLVIVNAVTKQIKPVSDKLPNAVKWSPDGKLLAFIVKNKLYVYNPDDNNLKMIKQDKNLIDFNWMNSGQR